MTFDLGIWRASSTWSI